MRQRASQPRSHADGGSGIVPWRRRRLERAGFGTTLAQALADDHRIDLHAVLELVDRGCPPDLAARIIAPLDDPQEGVP
jgi:hypothetical protein